MDIGNYYDVLLLIKSVGEGYLREVLTKLRRVNLDQDHGIIGTIGWDYLKHRNRYH